MTILFPNPSESSTARFLSLSPFLSRPLALALSSLFSLSLLLPASPVPSLSSLTSVPLLLCLTECGTDEQRRETTTTVGRETSARAAIIAGGRRRAPGSTFHENFSCYGSLSWSRGYARGGRSCAGRRRGRDAGVERTGKGWGARRGRETTEISAQRYEKGECGSERREMRLTRRRGRGRDARALCVERG